jgi:hypothetical protein
MGKKSHREVKELVWDRREYGGLQYTNPRMGIL